MAQGSGHLDYQKIVSTAAAALKKDLANAVSYLDALAANSN